MPFFSIIIPIYNVEYYIDECVKSVLSQSFSNYECILIDDGSPDKCPKICDEYAKKYEFIKTFHKENGGLSDARNYGIYAAIGEYIVFLDSDDMFADNSSLLNLYNTIKDNKNNVIFNANFYTFSEYNIIKYYNKYNKYLTTANPELFLTGIKKTKMFFFGQLFILNREYLLNNNLFFKTGLFHEDEHWMPRVIFSSNQITLNHSPFYAYRILREGSITSSISPKRLFDLILIINDLLNWSKNKVKYNKYARSYFIKKIKSIYIIIFAESKNLKHIDINNYKLLCIELRKILINIPLFFLNIKLLLIFLFGVNTINNIIFYKNNIIKIINK